MEEDVIYTKDSGIGIITLNRPNQLNAVTYAMLDRFRGIIDEICRDNTVRVVILTGNGRAFCSGTDIKGTVSTSADVDIKAMKEKNTTEYRASNWYFNSIPKPTICAINGAAVGIGSEFTLHCDIRIAAESARWGQIFVLRGLIPDTGAGTYLLPRIVGLSKACELVFSGDIIDAAEMLSIGLVTKVVPDSKLMPAAIEMAEKLIRGGPLVIQMAKQLMYMGLERSMEDHQQASKYCIQLCFKTEDFKEGIKSFLEKRPPKWSGK